MARWLALLAVLALLLAAWFEFGLGSSGARAGGEERRRQERELEGSSAPAALDQAGRRSVVPRRAGPVERALAPSGASERAAPLGSPAADRGWTIRGLVLGTDGRPAAHVGVSARGTAEELRDVAFGPDWTDLDGSFLLESLPPGDFALTASPTPDPFVACSSTVVASAGSEGVELQLRWGGSLAVAAIDAASEEPCAATVTLREASAGAVHRSGAYFEHLPAGIYEVVAWTQAGSIGVLPRVVVRERRAEEVRIVLAPGAQIRIGTLAPALALEGLDVFAGVEMRPAPASGWMAVPPGRVLVTGWRHRPDGTKEVVRQVERAMAPGEKWNVELR